MRVSLEKINKIIMLSSISLLSIGCAHHLTQEQCQLMNWYSEGKQDGNQGKLPRNLKSATEDCQQFGITININQYQAGYKEGAKQYCHPSSNEGYLDGQQGKEISEINVRLPVCQAANVSLDLSLYRVGRNQGLRTYCTEANGKLLALQGQSLPNVCAGYQHFSKGWQQGQNQFCTLPANGFALAKANKPYPDICPPTVYYAFKTAYDRGYNVRQRIEGLQAQIKAIKEKIHDLAFKNSYREQRDGSYELGFSQSEEANKNLITVNGLVRQKQSIERDLFNLEMIQ